MRNNKSKTTHTCSVVGMVAQNLRKGINSIAIPSSTKAINVLNAISELESGYQKFPNDHYKTGALHALTAVKTSFINWFTEELEEGARALSSGLVS